MLEDGAAVEVTVLIEMIMDRGVDGGEFLKGLDVPEIRHRILSSSERRGTRWKMIPISPAERN